MIRQEKFGDFDRMEFWAYCLDEVNCRNHRRLENYPLNMKINDYADFLVCSKCGKKGALIQRVFIGGNMGREHFWTAAGWPRSGESQEETNNPSRKYPEILSN